MEKYRKKLKNIDGVALDSILLAIIQIVTYISNIITTKILALELSLHEYGTYATVNSIIIIASSLTLFGLGDTINYFFNQQFSYEDKKMRESYINTIFLVQVLIGVVVGIILIIFSKDISKYYRNSLVQSLLLLVFLKPLISNIVHLYQVLFVSNGRAKLIAIRNFIISIMKIFLLFVATKISKSLSMVFIYLVLLDLLQLLVFKYIFQRSRFKVNIFKYSKEKIIPVIRYAFPMGMYFVTNTLMREIDKLVIGGLGTTQELAIYSNCARSLPLNFIVVSFATVLIPYIMKYISLKNYKIVVEIMREYLSIGYLSVWMFSIPLLLCASEAIKFFYSEAYIQGMPIFIIYILDGMIHFASIHLIIAAEGKSKFLMKTSISLLIINGILSIIMYKFLEKFEISLIGPAVVTLISSISYTYILLKKSVQIIQVKIIDLLPLKHMSIYLIKLIILGICFYFFKLKLNKFKINWIFNFFMITGGFYILVITLYFKEFMSVFSKINQLRYYNKE